MVKICRECGEEKDLKEFSMMKSSMDGRGKVCTDCRETYQKGKGKKRELVRQ